MGLGDKCAACGYQRGLHRASGSKCPVGLDSQGRATEWTDQSFLEPGSEPPILPRILAALGWSGGTVEQVVAEVGRLKAAKAPDEIVEDAVLHVEIMNALDENFGGHSLKQIEDVMTIFKTVWRNRKPLGQGVAALLPEHEANP